MPFRPLGLPVDLAARFGDELLFASAQRAGDSGMLWDRTREFMTTRPLAGFQERFLMFVGVLALLAVEFKVVLRPEISIGGSEGMWVKGSLFAMTLILMAYSVADDSEEFWISLPGLGFVYGPSFLYMYIHKGVETGVLVLITLALTMLVVSVVILVLDGTKLGWSEVVYAIWLAVGLSATLCQRGILIDVSDYRSTLDLVPTQIPLRWLLDLRTFVSVLLGLTILLRALSAAFGKPRSPIDPLPEWRDISEPSGIHELIRAVLQPLLGGFNAASRILRWLANFTWIILATVLRVLADIVMALINEVGEIVIKSPVLRTSARAAVAFLIMFYVIHSFEWFSLSYVSYLRSTDFIQETGLLVTSFGSAVAVGVLAFVHTWLLSGRRNSVASAEGTAGLLLCCMMTGVLCFLAGLLPWKYRLEGFQHAGPATCLAGLIAAATFIVGLTKPSWKANQPPRSRAHSSGR